MLWWILGAALVLLIVFHRTPSKDDVLKWTGKYHAGPISSKQ